VRFRFRVRVRITVDEVNVGSINKNNAGISVVHMVQPYSRVKVGGMAMALSMPDMVGWGGEWEGRWPVRTATFGNTHTHTHIHTHSYTHTHPTKYTYTQRMDTLQNMVVVVGC